MKSLYLAVCCAALVAACGGSGEEPKGVLPEHQKDALEKAEDVENVLQGAQERRAEQIDEQ